MPGERATNPEIEQRVDKVFSMIIAGSTPREIFRFISEKTDWGISYRQLTNYIDKANERLLEASQIQRQQELGKAISRLNNLYRAAYQIQDYRVCATIQKQLTELLGLSEPSRLSVQGPNGQPVVDATVIAAELARLLSANGGSNYE